MSDDRFDPRYTDEERRAIVFAIVDDGSTARSAVARAASDGLYGTAPFDMPASTATNLAWREKRSRARDAAALTDPTVEITDRLLALATRSLEDMERNGATAQEIRDMTRALDSARRLHANVHADLEAAHRSQDAADRNGAPGGFVARLIRREAIHGD